jgi:hypothetical protein
VLKYAKCYSRHIPNLFIEENQYVRPLMVSKYIQHNRNWSCSHNMQVAYFFQNFFENLQIGQNKNVHFWFWNTFYKKKIKKCHFCKWEHNAQNSVFGAKIFVTINFEGYLWYSKWHDVSNLEWQTKKPRKSRMMDGAYMTTP